MEKLINLHPSEILLEKFLFPNLETLLTFVRFKNLINK